jgi:flagellin-specific chaperone FliS
MKNNNFKNEQQCAINDVISRFSEATNVQERMKVEIYKDLLVELYDFAYEQAVKTNTVKELHDIDRRINGC